MIFLMMMMIAISIKKMKNVLIKTATKSKKSLLFNNNSYFELPVKHLALQVLTSAFISHLSPV